MNNIHSRPATLALFCAALTLAPIAAASAANYTILYSFTGGAQGYNAHGKPLLDAKGDIFGTTVSGGTADQGTVYRLTVNSVFSVLHSFQGSPDGSAPFVGLVADSSGDLYGTTPSGGVGNRGTVFQMGIRGSFYRVAPLVSAFGTHPQSGLVMDAFGNLYGMAQKGGAAGFGTVYKVQPGGKISVLHSFTGGADGEFPSGGSLAEDAAGNLYGTTQAGRPGMYGVVFKVTPAGEETVIHAFYLNNQNCSEPNNSLAIDKTGNIYGSTFDSGGVYGHGCVYRLSPDGTYTVLHYFQGNNGGTDDGAYPEAGVTLDSDGNVYGTTALGGYDNIGTIYRVTPSGHYTLLHSFANGLDGNGQYTSELAIGAHGAVLGVNESGGTFGYGNLFRITQ